MIKSSGWGDGRSCCCILEGRRGPLYSEMSIAFLNRNVNEIFCGTDFIIVIARHGSH